MSGYDPGDSRLAAAAAADGNGRGVQRESALILEEDPDLGLGLNDADLRAATRLLRAPMLRVDGPQWRPPEFDPARAFGLLVLDGLLGRRVRVGRAINIELLSRGDILRPWEEPALWAFAPPESSWRVLRPARVAILDERITSIIGHRPELVVAFSGRLLRRARYAALLAAIGHLTRVEERLLLTLWHLASSWGRVTALGVCVPFPLTHEVLGEIVGARRPSVTVAISGLQRSGAVVRRSDGCYVLTGAPPSAAILEREATLEREVSPGADPGEAWTDRLGELASS